MTGFFEGRGNPHTTVTPHELGEHQDVTISTPTQGDILQYEEATDTWINRPAESLSTIGHIIADTDETFPQRLTLMFEGTGVEVVDEGGTNKTVVTIDTTPETDLPSLPIGTRLAGNELAALYQNGDGVQATVEEISGNPLTMQMSHARDKNRSFTNFSTLSTTYNSGIVSGVAMDLEPFLVYTSGTGAGVVNTRSFLGNPGVLGSTGSTTTGRVCIAHKDTPLLSRATSRDFDCRQTVAQAPPLAGNEFIAQFGFINSAPEIAVFGSHLGVFFELTVASANWQARWISATGGVINNRTVDTGIAADGATPQCLRVHLRSHPTDVAERKADFYIDGELVASIPYNPGGGVAAMPDNTALTCAYVIKSTGITGAGPVIFGHNSNFSVTDQTLYEHL